MRSTRSDRQQSLFLFFLALTLTALPCSAATQTVRLHRINIGNTVSPSEYAWGS